MKKSDIIKKIFHNKIPTEPKQAKGLAFAPTNIALCKYWGKRDTKLNLPMTSSLSISLPDKGSLTTVGLHDLEHERVILNGKELDVESDFVIRISRFLDLFRPKKQWYLQIDINMTLPVAAGLASSACGFASLVLSLRDLFDWKLQSRDLSILARLGSGSACRSLWAGFVEWHAGIQADGMDSYGEPLPFEWPELCLGILSVSDQPKHISSRKAMQQTVDTSVLYASWPKKVTQDLIIIKQALHLKNLSLLGGASESNALTMHGMMLSCWPPICYFLPDTISAMQKIWNLRKEGLELYFTEDAGPNLKLLFTDKNKKFVQEQFPTLEIHKVFD